MSRRCIERQDFKTEISYVHRVSRSYPTIEQSLSLSISSPSLTTSLPANLLAHTRVREDLFCPVQKKRQFTGEMLKFFQGLREK